MSKQTHEEPTQSASSTLPQPSSLPHNPGQPTPVPGQKSSTSLATVPQGGQLNSPEAIAAMLLEDEGAGREQMSARDIAIPRLSILQALSPACTKGDPAYIKGAEVGEIYDNIQNKRWPGETGITVIPVTYRSTYLEWKPRKLGGGFVGDAGSDPDLSQITKGEKGELITKAGNELVLTAEYFCVMIDPDTNLPRQVVISMAKTQFKAAKTWNAMISNLVIPRPDGKGTFNPAMFYKSYRLTTIPQSNDQGSWFGWHITMDKDTMELADGLELYLGSRNFRKSVAAGEVKVADPNAIMSEQAGDIDSADI